jgi:hypothetical protein
MSSAREAVPVAVPATSPESMRSADDLRDLVAHRRWVRRSRPFGHVVARDVFTPEFYGSLDAQVQQIIGDGTTFARNMGAYDATSSMLERHREGPLGVFLSRAWHDLMAGIWGMDATGDVTASLHHHEPGGRSGWPHNDLNPGWFPGPPPGAGEVRLAHNEVVDYQQGTRASGVEAREVVRGAALLYYLGNSEWQQGDGGETALYDSLSGSARGPYAAVPPINNSLVMFECTPFSWHSFLTNRTPRTSVVMWVHRRKDEAVERWGEQSIVYW